MKKKALMGLYTELIFDPRAKKAIEIIKDKYDLIVITKGTKNVNYDDKNYKVKQVFASRNKFLKYFGHFKIWGIFIFESIKQKPKLIYCCNYFMIIPSIISAKLLKVSSIYDAYELMFNDNKKLSKRDKIWYKIEKTLIKKFTIVIEANEERAKLVKEHYGLKYTPEFINNYPKKNVTKIESNKIIKMYPQLKRNSYNEKLIIYQGALALERNLKYFIQAFTYLPNNYRMIMVGDGTDKDKINSLIIELGLEDKISLIGKVYQHQVYSITRNCDLGIVSYSFDGFNNIYCAPNKVYEYAQAGIPIIATNQPPIISIIKNSKIGEYVEYFNNKIEPIEIAKKIQYIIENINIYKENVDIFAKENTWESKDRSKFIKILDRID